MKSTTKLASVLDDILVEANTASQQRAAEVEATKIAETQPRTELGKDLRALAQQLRSASNEPTYGDLA